MTPDINLNVSDQELDENDHAKYRSILASLPCLAVKTRPGVLVASSLLSSNVHQPTQTQLSAAKEV